MLPLEKSIILQIEERSRGSDCNMTSVEALTDELADMLQICLKKTQLTNAMTCSTMNCL